MLRTVIAVILGYAVWTAIWLGGNALLFGEATRVIQAGERYAVVAPLLGSIALSIVCSVIAGVAAAAIAKDRSRPAVLVVAALLLVTGIGVQISAWSLMPVWYHLTFLVLLVPMTLAGGKLAGSRAP